MSCGNPDETPSPPEPITTYSRNDLTGVWVLKGNSSTMALVSLNLSYGLTYYGYWGDYSARYELIEYELNNSNYAFKGRYSGGLIFNENTIKFDKADTYMPQLKTAGSEYNDKISRQHSFYKDFSVELLNETKTKFRFSSGNSFFEATKSTEFVTGYNSPMVGPSDFANMGLSVHWAKCNIGASKAEEYGLYVGWADPTGTKVSINLEDYPAAGYPNVPETICGSQYDVATQKWGSKWRMPTIEQIQELETGCISEKIIVNGINGYKYTGITGESIFLPCAGYREGTNVKGVGNDFYYWTGDIYSYGWDYAFGLFKGSLGGWYTKRYTGCQVRPVCNK